MEALAGTQVVTLNPAHLFLYRFRGYEVRAVLLASILLLILSRLERKPSLLSKRGKAPQRLF